MDDLKKDTLTQHQLRAALDVRTARLDHHLTGIKKELTTLNDVNVGGRPVTDYVREDPLLAVGVAAGVGLVAGLIGGLIARETPEEPSDHDLWMGAYLDDLVDEAGARVIGGEDADTALGRALRRRAPVIVVEPEEPKHTPSTTLNVLLNTALGFGAKFALDQVARQFTGEDGIIDALQDAPEPPPAPLPEPPPAVPSAADPYRPA